MNGKGDRQPHLVCADIDKAFDPAIDTGCLQQNMSSVSIVQRKSETIPERVVDVCLQPGFRTVRSCHIASIHLTRCETNLCLSTETQANLGCKVHDGVDFLCVKDMSDEVCALNVCLHELRHPPQVPQINGSILLIPGIETYVQHWNNIKRRRRATCEHNPRRHSSYESRQGGESCGTLKLGLSLHRSRLRLEAQ